MSGCSNCYKSKEVIAYEKAVNMAQLEANLDKRVTIVYKLNDKYYAECRDCWRKNGENGEVVVTVYPL